MARTKTPAIRHDLPPSRRSNRLLAAVGGPGNTGEIETVDLEDESMAPVVFRRRRPDSGNLHPGISTPSKPSSSSTPSPVQPSISKTPIPPPLSATVTAPETTTTTALQTQNPISHPVTAPETTTTTTVPQTQDPLFCAENMPETRPRQNPKTHHSKPPLHPNTKRRTLDLHALFNAAIGDIEAGGSDDSEPEDQNRVLTAIEEDWIDEDLRRADRGDDHHTTSEDGADSEEDDAETLLAFAERMRHTRSKGKAIDTTAGSSGQNEAREEGFEGGQPEVETIPVPFARPSKKKRTTVTRPAPKGKKGRKPAPRKTKAVPTAQSHVTKESAPRRLTRQTARAGVSEPQPSPDHSVHDQPGPSETQPDSDSSFTLVEGFSSQRAKDSFEKLRSKPALPERGFDDRTLADLDFIRSAVEFQGWKKLSKVRKAYNLTLVRCFYAEAASSKRDILRVRGVRVEFRAEAFNSLLGLNPPEIAEFDDLMSSATKDSLDDLIRDLAQPNTDWTPHDNYQLRTFRTCNLVPNANVWMNFITHTVSPTTHTSSASVERMILLHCILANKSINVGEIILRRMRYCAGRAQGKLFYPFLVQKLCKRAGVPVYEDDEIIRQGDEKWTIGLREVSRLKTAKGSGDLVTVVQNLVEQNRELTTSLISLKSASKAKIQIKIEKARTIWKKEAKRKRKELVRKAKRMKKDNKRLESILAEKEKVWDEERAAMQGRLGLLQKKIEEMEAAATNAAALSQHSQSGQPTPSV